MNYVDRTMKFTSLGVFLWASTWAATLVAQPPVSTAQMVLTSGGPYVFDGVYVGPYYATIDGVPTQVICDDFLNDTFVPEDWTANVFTGPSTSTQEAQMQLPQLSGAALTSAYNEAAYLALQLLQNAPSNGSGNATTVGEIDFALWNVLDPGAISSSFAHGSAAYNGSMSWYNQALQNASTGTAYISQFEIYSPNTSDPITCPGYGGSVCPNTPPQEFLVPTPAVPEPAQLPLLGMDFAGVGLLCALVWRARKATKRA